MTEMDAAVLDEQAREILRTNDRGGFTVPTARLYPYQWNWDSAFVALGFAVFDPDRAWRELESLFEGQWESGMLPHIIFRRHDPDYFPGPDEWASGTAPPTSGHSQPPVAATVVRALYELGGEEAESRARNLFPKLARWHAWMHAARDPDQAGVIAVTHPWESGRDNSPDWDSAISRVDASGVGPYQRRDTSHVDAKMRPTKDDYDRYVTILRYGRKTGWDMAQIARDGPFFVADPGMTFILLRAERDLLAMALMLGEPAAEIRERIGRMEAGAERLWNPEIGAYCARDLRTDAFADAVSCGAFLSLYAGLRRHADEILATLRRFIDGRRGVPSFDPADPRFDPLRYWRGPAWAIITYMIARGAGEIGESHLAKRLRGDVAALIAEGGFAEYFNPVDGAPAGGGAFSWTAAMWLCWASPTAPRLGEGA